MEDNQSFEIIHHNQTIKVFPGKSYRLVFPDGRWLYIGRYPDDTQTTAVDNANISYSIASVWVIEEQMEIPDWLSPDQVQVIGELINIQEKKSGDKPETT